MIKYIVFSIILFLITVILNNKNYYHYKLVFTPQNIYWYYYKLSNEERKIFSNIMIQFDNISLLKYIKNTEKNQREYISVPLYDGGIILNKYDKEYTNPVIYGKKNSLPHMLTELIVPKDLLGNWYGDSVFLTDLKNRGPNNLMKENYLYALQSKYLNIYRSRINHYFNNELKNKDVSLFDLCESCCMDITYLIHFNTLPTEEEKYYCKLFTKSFATYFIPKYFKLQEKYIYESQEFTNKTKIRIDKINQESICLVAIWKKYKKIKDNYILTEFLHNIVGMTVNWTNTMFYYIKNYVEKKIPSIKTDKQNYIHECFRYICPAKIIASRVNEKKHLNLDTKKNFIVYHNLDYICRMKEYFGENSNLFNENNFSSKDFINSKDTNCSKCPFHRSKKNAVFTKNTTLCEKEGYVAFGEGYRRCPGEHLSYIFLEELISVLMNRSFKLHHKGVTKIHKYIWDHIDRNIFINIS